MEIQRFSINGRVLPVDDPQLQSALAQIYETPARRAAQVLERRSEPSDARESIPGASTTEVKPPADRSHVRTEAVDRNPAATPPEGDHLPPPGQAGRNDRKGPASKGPTFDQVVQRAMSYGITGAQYHAYADQRWGRGCTLLNIRVGDTQPCFLTRRMGRWIPSASACSWP